jgi:chromosome segregation ATPase
MSAQAAENLAPEVEVDRFEAQRQAFSRLMARFTADRDGMIAAVQQCNERIDALSIRLAGGETIAAPAEGEASAGVAGLAEVRVLTERLLAQQQSALAEVRTAGDRALQRADEALRRVREVAEQRAGADSGSEELRQLVDSFDERLARLEEALLAEGDGEHRDVGALPLAEQAARLAALEGSLQSLTEAFESLRRDEHEFEGSRAAAGPLAEFGLSDLREQVSRLESLAAWTPKLQRLWVSLVASAAVAAMAVAYAG